MAISEAPNPVVSDISRPTSEVQNPVVVIETAWKKETKEKFRTHKGRSVLALNTTGTNDGHGEIRTEELTKFTDGGNTEETFYLKAKPETDKVTWTDRISVCHDVRHIRTATVQAYEYILGNDSIEVVINGESAMTNYRDVLEIFRLLELMQSKLNTSNEQA